MPHNQLAPGESARFDCTDCLREFEVTLEPKCHGKSDLASAISDGDVGFCPFCGRPIPIEED